MLKDLVKKNRSYRGYDRTKPIPEKELKEFVDLCRYVASSINRQPLKFHIASNEAEVAAIQQLTGWAKGLPDLNLPYHGMEPTSFIVISIDKTIDNRDIFDRDVGACAQTILLAATEKGYGGCMLGTFRKGELKRLLGFGEFIEPNLVVALGTPKEKVVITKVGDDRSTDYYRDEEGKTHYVPKRSLKDILN
ncbi:MAG: nitroreductase family protein [Spirochaetales bacterium]|nr:nitroreductase family protein [Candidatus Physcosoma equi]